MRVPFGVNKRNTDRQQCTASFPGSELGPGTLIFLCLSSLSCEWGENIHFPCLLSLRSNRREEHLLVCKGRQASAELGTLVRRLKVRPDTSCWALSSAPDTRNLCEGRNRGPMLIMRRKEQRGSGKILNPTLPQIYRKPAGGVLELRSGKCVFNLKHFFKLTSAREAQLVKRISGGLVQNTI